MRWALYPVFILLMQAGNCFALYKLCTDKQEFLIKFPRLTETAFSIFRFLPPDQHCGIGGLMVFSKLGGLPCHSLRAGAYRI